MGSNEEHSGSTWSGGVSEASSCSRNSLKKMSFRNTITDCVSLYRMSYFFREDFVFQENEENKSVIISCHMALFSIFGLFQSSHSWKTSRSPLAGLRSNKK